MSHSDKSLQARLQKLSPAQREALLKKLRQQKPEKPAASRIADTPIAARERTGAGFPLSFAQQRLWVLEQLNPGSAVYNIAAAVELTGPLDQHLLQQSFQRIIQRHESLRTIFRSDNNGIPQQFVEATDWHMPVIDLQQQPQAVEQAIHDDANTGFDLQKGPLLRVRLYQLAPDRAVLTIVMHHIIADAWSSQLLLGEVSRIYSALSQGTAIALPPPKIHYIDYACWQKDWLQQPHCQQQRDYWLDKLKHSSNLNLASDKPRPAVMSNRGDYYRLKLDAGLLQQFQALCRQHNATLFNGLLTVFECLLYRYTRQTDFCIGTPVAGRVHPDLEPLIGFFVNTLALRCDMQPGDSFRSLLRKIKKTTLEAQAQQDIPFEQLVDELDLARDSSYSPVFQAFFSYHPGDMAELIQLPGISARLIEADTDTAKFDLSLMVNDKNGELSCHFEYNSDLFERQRIIAMAGHFRQLLHSICQAPESDIDSLTMLQKAEFERLTTTATTADFPQTDIASLFEQQAAATATKTAVVQGDRAIDYQNLNSMANRLARHLQAQGVQQGDSVGVCLPPSLDLATALLAIIKLGGVYVPLDPSYPAERLNYMVDNAAIEVLVSHSRAMAAPLSAGNTLLLDELALDDYPDHNLQRHINPDDKLYLIYTSGSTGQPKATVISHRNEANLLHWYSREFHLQADDKVLVFSAIGFDLTQKNLLAPLCYGAQLHFCTTEYYEPQALLDCIANQGISWVNCAPSAFYPLVQAGQPEKLASLRQLFFGGEPIRPGKLRDWTGSGHCHAAITNMYGPTECTDIATSYTIGDIHSQKVPVPIGKPSANVSVLVLDSHKNPVPEGAIGELYIGGTGVGKGYLNKPTLTAERFIDNPFRPGETIYRTGDLVRFNIDGDLEFVSRADDQIKVRGLRIEPGEIEARLRQLDGVNDALVSLQDINGQQQLVAFVVGRTDPQACKKALRKVLPDFMIPVAFLPIDSIPLTPNGKVDHRRLPAVDSSAITTGQQFVAPRHDTDRQLAAIWQAVLGLDSVSIADGFFELGGNSLLATQVMTRIRDTFGVDLPLRTLFEVNTIEGISDIILATGHTQAADDEPDDAFEEGFL